MRALSVRQPWASLIASGRKTVELRSWATKYRGPLLILAGSSVWRGEHAWPIGPRGVSVCVVELVDCREMTPDDAELACLVPPEGFGFAWVLRDARRVNQVATKGKLGLYSPDEALLSQI